MYIYIYIYIYICNIYIFILYILYIYKQQIYIHIYIYIYIYIYICMNSTDPFSANVPFLKPLKTLENQWLSGKVSFPDVFRWNRKGEFGENWFLMQFKWKLFSLKTRKYWNWHNSICFSIILGKYFTQLKFWVLRNIPS